MNELKQMTGYYGDWMLKDGGVYGATAALGTDGIVVLDWIIVLEDGCTIEILEEYRNSMANPGGLSTNVLSEHNFTAGDSLPQGYIIKSSNGNGFSKIKISGGVSQGFKIQPLIARNSVSTSEGFPVVNVSAPVNALDPADNDYMIVTNGTWKPGLEPINYKYQWIQDSLELPGENSARLHWLDYDSGSFYCKVTATGPSVLPTTVNSNIVSV